MIKDSCPFPVSFWVGLVVFADNSSPSSTPFCSNIPSLPTWSRSAVRTSEWHQGHLGSPRWVRRSLIWIVVITSFHTVLGVEKFVSRTLSFLGFETSFLSDGPVKPPHTMNSQREESRSSLPGPELSTPTTHSPVIREGHGLPPRWGGRAFEEEAWKAGFWAPPVPESEPPCFSPHHGPYRLRFFLSDLIT